MKTLKTILALTLAVALAAPLAQADDMARLQVIHNAADPAAEEVDIYVNGDLFLDDFEFRTATPFVDVPAGVTLNIGVAPEDSESIDDTLVNIPVVLDPNQTYVAIANGVLDPTMFAANPDGEMIGFSLYARDNVREMANDMANVDFIAFHGATDAPTVDVIARGVATVVDDLTYGSFTDYVSVPAGSYILDVTPGNDNSTIVASFEADLSGLGGGAAVVFASGFLSSDDDMYGEGFGLFAALPNGTVVTLPPFMEEEKFARLQVIHNAADPAAEVVDIYVNGDLLLDDFTFRTATPFVDVPAGVTLNIGVAPGTSGSADDTLVNIPVVLEEDETYVAIANGVLDPSMFAGNPDGKMIGFQLFTRDDVREKSRWRGFVDLLAFHGATDAPTVDISVRGWPFGPLVDDLSYGEFSRYRTALPYDVILEVTPGNDPNTVVAAFEAPLSAIKNQAAVVFASGFLAPADNMNGAAFGLFAALPNGDVVELPALNTDPTARLQVIHNAADPGASVVDIYVNGDLFQDNFAFRTATPFVDVPAGVTLNIGVAPGNSGSVDDTLVNIPVTLEANKTYVAIANGVLDPGAFAANPDGEMIGFKLFAQDGIKEQIPFARFAGLIAFHGATDAPTVDIRVSGGWRSWPLFGDLTYGEFSDYRVLPAREYTLEVTPAGDRKTVVAAFTADLSGLKNKTAVVFASGFLSPADNNDGPAFGLFAALADGTVVPLMPSSAAGAPAASMNGANELVPNRFELAQNYPNPFNPTTNIAFSLPTASDVSLVVFNLLGQEVAELVNGQMEAGQHTVQFDASNLSSGVYFYRLETNENTETRKMLLVK